VYTQRQKKTAHNKKILIDTLLQKMSTEPFEKIKISDLCRDSSVSQASFYNYFPQKKDMIVYYIQLWSLETAWHARHDSQSGGGLKIIESIFMRTAESLRNHPQIMAEVISFQAKMEMPEQWPELTDADKILAFPNLEGIEDIESKGLDGILLPNLKTAISQGELPAKTPVMNVVVALTSLFFGIPMILHAIDSDQLELIFKQQLELIWAGARSIGKEA